MPSFLGDGLIFEESLPVAWTAGPLVKDMDLARLNADNHQLLGAESSLEEVRVPEALKDESTALLHEMQRLEFKLNVLLRLTAEIARQQNALPPARLVRFSARGLEWIGADAPAVAATGLIDLYINSALPQPLRLPGRVIGEHFHKDLRAAEIQFSGLSEPVVEFIEKLIFRRHRRLIAGARSTPSP
jgi:hypothetical protein